MRAWMAGLVLVMAGPALADVKEAVEGQILPGMAGFAAATSALAEAAGADCSAAAVQPAWNAAFDAWLKVSFLHLGPGEEEDGRNTAIAFWPDAKGMGAKQQGALMRAADPAALEPALFAKQSVAVRGLFGLERLLYPAEPPANPEYACALMRATASDLAAMAGAIDAEWRGPLGFAQKLETAGAEGNTSYRTELEARQALYTQLVTGVDFIRDQRLGRPLGTFDAPKPERAEARASGRSLQNIRLSLEALRGFSLALVPAEQSPRTVAAFDRAIKTAAALQDPVLAGVADPSGRLKVEILQQQVGTLVDTIQAEVGPALDVGVGFNAADGD